MKIAYIVVTGMLVAIGFAHSYAEEYQGVLQIQSHASRTDLRSEAIIASHRANPYADGMSSVVMAAPAAAPAAPRDRAAVVEEARAKAHATNQNVRPEAFTASRIPSSYDIARRLVRRQAGNSERSSLSPAAN